MKVVVCGLGFGAQVHIPAFLQLDEIEVMGIFSRNYKKTAEIADKYQVHAYQTIEEIINDHPHFVSLAIPPIDNFCLCKRFLQNQTPVLSEKPLAPTFSQCKELTKIADAVPTGIDFQFAELPAFQQLHQILKNNFYGPVQSIKFKWEVESYAQKHQKWSWKTDAKQQGGIISLLASHFLYLVEWLFEPISELNAVTSNQKTKSFCPPEQEPAEEHLEMQLTLNSGTTLEATIDNACPNGCGHYWFISCEKADIILHNPGPDYMSGFYLEERINGHHPKRTYEDCSNPESDGRLSPFMSLAERFVSSIRSQSAMTPNFSHGTRVQQLTELIHQSNQLRQPVFL